jgi:hypothetical protein
MKGGLLLRGLRFEDILHLCINQQLAMSARGKVAIYGDGGVTHDMGPS